MIWANLLHLSFNMWADRETPELDNPTITARPYLRCDTGLWDELTGAMARAGANMVVIDLGDGVKYESHPEIAVDGAWSVETLRTELGRLRSMGLEPIPKLNFSSAHDAWLGPYSRCLSTPAYYEVCRDLIQEVIAIFDQPRYFHLGMDEETAQHQVHYAYAVVRQWDLWWEDLYFYIAECENRGVRPWVWSDYLWHHPEAFFAKMPRSVVQSNWHYGAEFGLENERVKAYLDLEEHGYDQVPTGSNWTVEDNFARTVAFCRERIASDRLMGFLQTTWYPTLPEYRDRHLRAIEQIAVGRGLV